MPRTQSPVNCSKRSTTASTGALASPTVVSSPAVTRTQVAQHRTITPMPPNPPAAFRLALMSPKCKRQPVTTSAHRLLPSKARIASIGIAKAVSLRLLGEGHGRESYTALLGSADVLGSVDPLPPEAGFRAPALAELPPSAKATKRDLWCVPLAGGRGCRALRQRDECSVRRTRKVSESQSRQELAASDPHNPRPAHIARGHYLMLTMRPSIEGASFGTTGLLGYTVWLGSRYRALAMATMAISRRGSA